MAGINCRASIWRWTFATDDSVGGAYPTGTFIYTDALAFMQEQQEEMLLTQQQGLETRKIFKANLYPGWYAIKEEDEFEVNAPTDHTFYGDRFKIIRVAHSSHNRRDPRGYVMLTMTRSEVAHAHQ